MTHGKADTVADEHVVSDDPRPLEDRNQPRVIVVDVDAVVVRQCDGGLELPRKVHVSVERLLLFGRKGLLAVEPDFVIGPRRRSKLDGDLPRDTSQRHVGLVVQRGRAGHHIAFYVAAGRDRGQQRVIDPRNGRFEVLLDDAVELKPLPRGNS